MVKFSQQFTFATTIAVIILGAIDLPKTQAASLYLGLSKYVENIQIDNNSNLEKIASSPQLITRQDNTQEDIQFSNAQEINNNIRDRYHGLIEESTDQIGLIEAQKILNEQGLLEEISPENSEQNSQEISAFLDQNSPWIGEMLGEGRADKHMPKSILYSLILLFGIWSIPTLNYLIKTFILGKEGIVEDLKDKFSNPKVPEGTVFLHERAFEELEQIAKQVERINLEKFGNAEFLLFLKIKQSIEKGKKEYQILSGRAELLKVAIATQSSFLKIEQTELRFRSRNQQEFYQFVIDSLNQDLDKAKFRDRVKRKLAEIIPLLNTEKGRDALQSYLKEIDKISEHKLGLKLLSLFKKYQLADFTILKRVSDLVNQLQGCDLLAAKNLVTLAINDYEIFEKLAPIIGVSESDNSPETYANILQYIGLIYRHEKSYDKFQQLLEAIKKWQKPYKTVTMIRKEYKASEYRLPKEFYQEIPGLNIYKKYEKFLENPQQF